MSDVEFLSPDRAAPRDGFRPQLRSPLARALAEGPPGLHDISLLGKLEIRGDVERIDVPSDAELIWITPQRALIICPYELTATVRAALEPQLRTVVDRTGALAGLRIERTDAATLMRRLTDLDLKALPAAGAVAHAPAIVRGAAGAYDLFFPQEYSDYVAEVVLDTAAGLESAR